MQIEKTYTDLEIVKNLFGPTNHNLLFMEKIFQVKINSFGNTVILKGIDSEKSLRLLDLIYENLKTKKLNFNTLNHATILNFQELLAQNMNPKDYITTIHTKQKQIITRTVKQWEYVNSMEKNSITFGIGPAGTGKTYLAVAQAIKYFMLGLVKKIILVRPAVEAGERLGFLPGNMQDKINPYLKPMYDAMEEMLGVEAVTLGIEKKEIEIAPIAFMRGRTLENAFVIMDEAQNANFIQLKMLLTRLGNNSKMVLTGDITQIDLPHHNPSGLTKILTIMQDLVEVNIVSFEEKDSVRSPLVKQIVEAFKVYDSTNYDHNSKFGLPKSPTIPNATKLLIENPKNKPKTIKLKV